MHKSKKGYSLIETTVSILLISMAAIIIIIGAKAGLSGYIEGRKIHTINERLMESVEKDKDVEGVTRSKPEKKNIQTEEFGEFEGVYKTYENDETGMTYAVFE